MIDEPTISAWCHGVTYRPGWEIQPGGSISGEYVMIVATGPDVCDPGKTFETYPLFRIPEHIDTREQFYDWLIDVAIPGVEQHERYEWFRIEGRHHRDPHAPGMPAFATTFAS